MFDPNWSETIWQIRLVQHPKSISLQSSFLKWDILLHQASGSDQISRTNCSIASEIVFHAPHNDLSSFSISRARSKNQFRVPFFRTFSVLRVCFVRRRTRTGEKEAKERNRPFSVINSIFNLVCTFAIVPRPQNKIKFQPPFLHDQRAGGVQSCISYLMGLLSDEYQPR